MSALEALSCWFKLFLLPLLEDCGGHSCKHQHIIIAAGTEELKLSCCEEARLCETFP